VQKISIGQGQYTLLLNHEGGFIDDLILYKLGNESFMACVNAANIEQDFNWMKQFIQSNMTLVNKSNEYSLLALQGPSSLETIKKWNPQYFEILEKVDFMSIHKIQTNVSNLLIARSGYTGEFGFEIFCKNEDVVSIWKELLSAGATPIGLSARDSLRLEAGFTLYGNDMDQNTSPLHVGLKWATSLGKDFIGKEALLDIQEKGIDKKLVCFTMDEKAIARAEMSVLSTGGEKIGAVRSAGFLPTLGLSGGFAYISKDYSKIDTKVLIDVRGKSKLASIKKKPLFKSNAN
jgi:aminomethyltransferase